MIANPYLPIIEGDKGASTITGDKEQQARELLIRVKLYRLCAYVFAFVGIGIFAYVFHTHKSGSLAETFADPVIIAFMVVPFLPSFVLALKARKYEAELLKIIGTLDR